jgi:hypothetical protein
MVLHMMALSSRSLCLLVAVAAVASACRADDDLTRALDGGIGRAVTPAPSPAVQEWTDIAEAAPGNDTLQLSPQSVCFTEDEMVVADLRRQRVVVFSHDGTRLRSLGGYGSRPGQFLEIASVRCSRNGSTILVSDLANQRLSFFSEEAGFVRSIPAPVSPQIPVLGDYAPVSDGRWYSSWLGASNPLGPYLTEREWEIVPLVELRDPDGHSVRALGQPVAYRSPVARRVLNRTFLTTHRDTVWVLTQGDATVRGFTSQGAEVPPLRLPVYFRGAEPSVSVQDPLPRSAYRTNRMTYHPNVQGLAVVADSLFATIRYRKWGRKLVGSGGSWTIMPRAASSIEVFDRRGRVVQSFEVPGFGRELASDADSKIAVVTEMPDRANRVLFGTVPAP